MMIGLKRGIVMLCEFSEEWAENALETKLKLKDILKETAIDIQHVGSTSVKGLTAKPIIDIAIAVNNFEEVIPLIPELEDNGFIHKAENDNENHLFFSCGDFINDIRTHHIHVVLYNGEEWCNYLKFREILNRDDEKRKEYQDLKISLMEKFNQDRKKYTQEKESLIRRILNT